MEINKSLPLAVDLDGSLIRTDLSEESAIRYLIKKPWAILWLLLLLIQGRARAKRFLAERIKIDVKVLPYNHEVLEWLHQQKEAGQRLLLVSGSDQKYVDLVSQHLNIFSESYGSNGEINLIGRNKAQLLVDKFGENKFEYLGNSSVDLHVWDRAAASVVVSSKNSLKQRAKAMRHNFAADSKIFEALFTALRLHQWSKSLLVFVPAFASHKILEPAILLNSFLAFISFGMLSSAGYILNDISDLDADRNSSKKAKRPFAAGLCKISYGLILAIILLAFAFTISMNLSAVFSLILLVYFVSVLAYSARLKSQIIIDLVLLSGFYCLRVLAGGLATDIDVSRWLLLLCVFFFFSLASIKRYVELLSGVKDSLSGRGYRNIDISLIGAMGASSGFISALVVALWANSPEVLISYKAPQLLWLVCPLMLYWLGRIWILAGRGDIHHDPVVFALQDKLTYFVAFLAVVLIFFAANINLN